MVTSTSGSSASAEGGSDLAAPLSASSVSKRFSGLLVLDNVSLTVTSGSIHALVGSNGSGKSTFVKILTGVQPPEAGARISINGHLAGSGFDTHAARDLGVRSVHQDAPLIDTFTVAETAGLFHGYPTQGGRIRWKELRTRTEEVLDRLGIDISVTARAGELSAAERAMVTFALALADLDEHATPLIILDEATASLPTEDAELYLEKVRGAAEQGAGVLMVTHRLGEVSRSCDQVTVLSDGKIVYSGPTTDMSERDLAQHMSRGVSATEGRPRIGRLHVDVDLPAPVTSGPRLQVGGLTGRLVNGVDLTVSAGEILGITGLVGSGASEVGRLIAGVERRTAGAIELDGVATSLKMTPAKAIANGIAYLPADRLSEGGIRSLDIRQNMMLPNYGRYWARRGQETTDLSEMIDVFDVKPGDPDKTFALLSGGNQQKVLLAKWLLTEPKLLILDDPTVGVDPHTRETIFAVLSDLARRSVAVILISSEPDQLARICRRVLIIRKGKVASELVSDVLTAEDIALASAS